MNTEQASALMKALGSSVASVGNGWVRGKCPLAPWRHKSGKDSKPSFGLYVKEGERGRFHCFTCESGSLAKLIAELEARILVDGYGHGVDLSAARAIVEHESSEVVPLPEYSEYSGASMKTVHPLPHYFLDTFPPMQHYPRAVTYMVQVRGFPLEVCTGFDLRYDPEGDRIVFPYHDVHGNFAGCRGRGIQLPGEPSHSSPHHDYVLEGYQNNASVVFFNERSLNLDGPVVLVEGQMDALRVSMVFPKVVAIMTAKASVEKLSKLTQSDGVILMLDGDATGKAATIKAANALMTMGTKVLPIFLPTVDFEGKEMKSDPDKLGVDWIRNALTEEGII